MGTVSVDPNEHTIRPGATQFGVSYQFASFNDNDMSAFPECNPSDVQKTEQKLYFLLDHYQEAESVAMALNGTFGTNIDASVVIGWGGYESGYGSNTRATTQSNFFSQTAGSNWIGQAPCSNIVWACFGAFGASAFSAFYSPINMSGYQSANGTLNRPSAGFILADQLSRGANLAGAFQQIAGGGTSGGWDRADVATYGGNVSNTIAGARSSIDCLKRNNYL